MRPYSSHVSPDEVRIEQNRSVEPEGERLRAELTEWLRKNQIVSILLDTPEHIVQIDIAPTLPPCIKPVLTIWGSIYVKNEDELVYPPNWAGGVVAPQENRTECPECGGKRYIDKHLPCPVCVTGTKP